MQHDDRVMAVMGPFNFPGHLPNGHIVPALLAGNTIVFKPSELAPATGELLVKTMEKAGLPKGVLNVLTGRPEEIGATLTASPVVRKLSFTGSTRVGALLAEQCAPTLKKMSLELGGNAPFIVFDDADLDAAVEGAMASKFRNGGQTCVCANRIYVQDGVYDAFADKLKAAVAKLKIGNGLEDGTTTGPLIDEKAVAKVQEHIEDALAKSNAPDDLAKRISLAKKGIFEGEDEAQEGVSAAGEAAA